MTPPPVPLTEIESGLRAPVKTLPSKLFYDARGSELFERITGLPEYYLTRAEQAIMDVYAGEMCAEIGAGALLVELGSGSSLKTRALLDRLERPAAYVPVDISARHLAASAREIAGRYPGLEVIPVSADYDRDFALPAAAVAARKVVVYYPGSTIGNFHPEDAVTFLRKVREICGGPSSPGAGAGAGAGAGPEVLIGVDLKKDPGLLHRAYNDCEGVTAAFNLNILVHLNRVYGLDFDPDRFEHHAFYNEPAGRIEMHLRSLADQAVEINGARIEIAAGECIWTESSYKYSLGEFTALAARAGFRTRREWTDPNRLFGVQYLEANQG
ncbi:MAG TPA: L-histidine N(alpha)-methyltransferase [Anaerolineales bacterium]|nr:L-histidine N(alpha)-methyltransferase [Anaerolineales bacterium]